MAAHERRAAVRGDAVDVAHALDVMREALKDWRGMLRSATAPGCR